MTSTRGWIPVSLLTLGLTDQAGARVVELGTVQDVLTRVGHEHLDVEASLTARMLETGTGATIWTASARERHTVGEVTLFSGGEVFFDADDPEKAYGQLVEALVGRITPDFRVQWVRVRKDGTIRY
jgi:hypothetical protein